MIDALDRVADAITDVYGADHPSALVTLASGHASADSSRLTVRTPIPIDVEAVVPGRALLSAFKSLGANASVKVTDSNLIVSTGKRRVQIKRLENQIEYLQPQGDRFEVVPGLARALKKSVPFMSTDKTRAHFNGVRVTDDGIFSTNNVCITKVDYSAGQDYCIPDFLAEYIARFEDDPTHMAITPSAISLWYADGRSVRSLRMAEEVPDQIISVYQQKFEEPDFDIEGEWKEAFQFVMDEADRVVDISPDRISAEKGPSMIEEEVASPVAEPYSVTKAFAALIIKDARRMMLDTKFAISWAGDGISGLMALRR